MTRAPAPPYRGEGAPALWHVSEDPSISRFEPHVAATATVAEPRVWAIDTRHLPLYWFPRDCPRATFWAGDTTTADDVDRFLTGDPSRRVHVCEGRWLERVRSATIYAYRFSELEIEPDPDGTTGYWIARVSVEPLERVVLTDLMLRHVEAGIELRLVPTLPPLWNQVIASTLDFSGIRLRNASGSGR